jgi:hypothetical protein
MGHLKLKEEVRLGTLIKKYNGMPNTRKIEEDGSGASKILVDTNSIEFSQIPVQHLL